MTTPLSENEDANLFYALSPHLFCIAGFDGYFKRLNPAWGRTFGFTKQELVSKPYLEIVQGEDRERTSDPFKELTVGASTLAFENRCLTKDRSYNWLSWDATSLPERGSVCAIARDITKQKKREEEVSHVPSISRSSTDAIIGKTLEGIAVSWKAGAERVTGYSCEEMRGTPFLACSPPADPPR